ncbi:hypothetical protein [Streptomyces sp. BoleA5]|uniref:hypothetical protein n=1 Tax=Streptomyces sp. BoleA5 TaxID=1157637 RepID=UPI003B63BCDF
MPGRHMPGGLPRHGFLDAETAVRSGFARSLEPCLDPDDLAPGPRPWRRRPPGRTPGGRTTGATRRWRRLTRAPGARRTVAPRRSR